MPQTWLGNPGGCCCEDEVTPVPSYIWCPCASLPSTLFLTFSREVSGLYHNATLVYGPAPAGWEERIYGNTDPGTIFPSSANMWWSEETFSVTYYQPFPTTVTKNFKYCFACYKEGFGSNPNYIDRVWRYTDDGGHFGAIDAYFWHPFSFDPTVYTEGTSVIVCSPFSHSRSITATPWVEIRDGAEVPHNWDGITPPVALNSPVDYLLTG